MLSETDIDFVNCNQLSGPMVEKAMALKFESGSLCKLHRGKVIRLSSTISCCFIALVLR